MLDVFATYATDENAEINGAWQKLGDAELLIARSNNRKYSKTLLAKWEQNQAKLSADDDASAKLDDELIVESFADAILLGWRNVSYQGAEMPYSKDNAKVLLRHKDFRREVARLADSIEAYRAKIEDAQVKN